MSVVLGDYFDLRDRYFFLEHRSHIGFSFIIAVQLCIASVMRLFPVPSGAHTLDGIPFAGVMSPGNSGGTLRAGIACSIRCSCHASPLMRRSPVPSGTHTSDGVPFAGVMSPGNTGGHSAVRHCLLVKVLMPRP